LLNIYECTLMSKLLYLKSSHVSFPWYFYWHFHADAESTQEKRRK
jgi:hypothetical protein